MLCKLYLNCSAYLQNIFCFEDYLLNLYSIDSQCAQVNMLWKEAWLYLCGSSVSLNPWEPTQNIQNATPFFCSVINLTLQQQHLLKMVNSICQITQLKPKSNYYSASLRAIQRPTGLSRNYFMDKRTKINLYSCILPKGLLAQQYSSPIAFCANTFNLFLFSRISKIESCSNYDMHNVIFRCNHNYLTQKLLENCAKS